MTVIALKTRRALKTKPEPRTVRKPNKARAQRHAVSLYAGVSFGLIGAAGMALSLSHQAHGVQASTSASDWEAWAMAAEIDLGFIAAKLVPYIATSDVQRGQVERYAKPLAYGVLILSAYFNAAGFSGFVPVGAVKGAIDIVLGCAAPGIVFALSQMAAILLLKRSR